MTNTIFAASHKEFTFVHDNGYLYVFNGHNYVIMKWILAVPFRDVARNIVFLDWEDDLVQFSIEYGGQDILFSIPGPPKFAEYESVRYEFTTHDSHPSKHMFVNIKTRKYWCINVKPGESFRYEDGFIYQGEYGFPVLPDFSDKQNWHDLKTKLSFIELDLERGMIILNGETMIPARLDQLLNISFRLADDIKKCYLKDGWFYMIGKKENFTLKI